MVERWRMNRCMLPRARPAAARRRSTATAMLVPSAIACLPVIVAAARGAAGAPAAPASADEAFQLVVRPGDHLRIDWPLCSLASIVGMVPRL